MVDPEEGGGRLGKAQLRLLRGRIWRSSLGSLGFRHISYAELGKAQLRTASITEPSSLQGRI